ncbi:MAG: Nif11-like leader peptide family RiPP precursor [Aphanothece sp. CMT-3BRIN-NPC111]|jgi:predicted ribosomally synthesized peptide with nif11-like leader|nr:Nif11-like leader peptide family RiPP precursor [Aphanothece sp. CMT-3BRIN-NPC111]
MLNQLKELLQDPELQQKVKAAANQEEAINLLTSAGAKKGHNFTTEEVSQALAELTSVKSNELGEEELLNVSGGRAGASHDHMSCCSDCPSCREF